MESLRQIFNRIMTPRERERILVQLDKRNYDPQKLTILPAEDEPEAEWVPEFDDIDREWLRELEIEA